MKQNPILNLDSYKLGHINFYPKGVSEVYSNLTPRSVKYFNVPQSFKDDKIVWFGGQAAVKHIVQMFNENFFNIMYIDRTLEEYSETVSAFTGSKYDTTHLKELWELGYLPLEIKQLPEGSLVPTKVPVMTIRNTNPKFYWLTNWLETWLSNETWHQATSATIAYQYRKIGNYWYDKTGANKSFLDFAFHDFSLRGQTSMESGIKSGAGHLTSFLGSDTVPSVPYIKHYYGCDGLIACSVPATEHSIQTAFVENDYEYIKHMITEAVPSGIVSIVSDGYDYFNVLTNIIPSLKQEILSRPVNEFGLSRVVIRPDSGDPVRIICGENIKSICDSDSFEYFKEFTQNFLVDEVQSTTPHGEIGEGEVTEIFKWKFNGKYYKVTVSIDWNRYDKQYYYVDGSNLVSIDEIVLSPEQKGSIEILWDIFGGTINEKGYKVLDSHIGLIYGDSITMERANEIFKRLEEKGFSADNVVFGVGSATYQGGL